MRNNTWNKEHPDEMKQYKRNWYYKNQKSLYKKTLERRKEIAEWFIKFKENLKCECCGENHPAVIDFHHIDASKKEVGISSAVVRGWSIERIKKEISKCKIICSNCHRKLHWNEKYLTGQ